MRIHRHISILAAIGIAVPVLTVAPTESSAQTIFTQRQIIHQLRRRPPQGQFNGQQVIRQDGGPRVLRKRAPQPQDQVVIRRRPPQPGTSMMRVPQPQGGVARLRVPQPQSGAAEIRGPQPQGGGVAKFRAPPPSSGGGKPPIIKNPGGVKVASTDDRGLDVRPTGTAYPDNGRIDLEILFDYDSAQIDPGSVKQLIILGEALNDPELAEAHIVIAGHTDAAGSDAYNANLSLRRSQAVYDFLVNYAGVDASRLVPEGYGESLLKFPDAPESGQNRRVEIINLSETD